MFVQKYYVLLFCFKANPLRPVIVDSQGKKGRNEHEIKIFFFCGRYGAYLQTRTTDETGFLRP